MTFPAGFMHTRTFVFIALVFGVAVLLNAGKAQSAPANPQLAKLVAEPLPGHPKPDGNASFYKPNTLFQYIDGGADVYLLYDFQILLHQDFKSGAAEITADVYDMGKPEDAFGIYSAERSPRYAYIPIGAEGYRSKGVLNFFQDRFYVKLAGSGTGADALLDVEADLRVLPRQVVPQAVGALVALEAHAARVAQLALDFSDRQWHKARILA